MASAQVVQLRVTGTRGVGEGLSMAIEMNCPHCDEKYRFPERRRGEEIRCKVCEHGFVIGEKRERDRDSRAGFTRGRDDGPSGFRSKEVRRRRDDDEEDERRPRRKALEIGPELPWWEEYRVPLLIGAACAILIAVGLVVLLVINESKEPDRPQFQ